MTEWLKVRAWKVRIPQKGIVGSNPAIPATSDVFCRFRLPAGGKPSPLKTSSFLSRESLRWIRV